MSMRMGPNSFVTLAEPMASVGLPGGWSIGQPGSQLPATLCRRHSVRIDMAGNAPRVLSRPPQDHRHVDPEELKKIAVYNVIMNRQHSTMMDYAMTKQKDFLKSTSGWTELHLVAFRCLLLEKLPITRILPETNLPDDDDPTMQLVIKHLLDTEDDIRSGRSLLSLGPATSFYQQLQVVLRRPATPPSPIPVPRTLRPGSSTAVFPTVPDSMTTSDSSYEPSPDSPHAPTPGPESPQRPRGSMDISERSRKSTESARSGQSSSSGASFDEDKLELVANQAVVSFLGLLCSLEQVAHPNSTKRLNFRFSVLRSPVDIFSNETLPPKLMVHGVTLDSYNDGSYYLESRSSTRPNEWVRRDIYPRASVEVRQPALVL